VAAVVLAPSAVNHNVIDNALMAMPGIMHRHGMTML
jgi:hypothetical protein